MEKVFIWINQYTETTKMRTILNFFKKKENAMYNNLNLYFSFGLMSVFYLCLPPKLGSSFFFKINTSEKSHGI